MKTIKFKRAHFFDEKKTKFSNFTEWGVGIEHTLFTSPANNYARYFEDLQFIGSKDKTGKDIYEGDIITENLFWDITKKDIVYFEVVFVKNGFKLKDKKGQIFEIGKEPLINGNIFENKELLK